MLDKVDIISTVIRRSVEGRPVPTSNTIIMQGGSVDIDLIIDKITADLRDKYLSKTTEDEAIGLINFKPGIKVGGVEFKYDSTNNAVYVQHSDGSPVNFYATGGLSMYGQGKTSVKTIMDAIAANLDPKTLAIENGLLTVIGGTGGGIESITKQMVIEALGFTPYSAENPNGYITAASIPSALKNPYALTFGSKTYDGSAAKSITASDLGAALSSDLSKYLPLSGGTVSNATTTPLTVNSTNTEANLQVSVGGSGKALFGYKTGVGTWMRDSKAYNIVIGDDGVLKYGLNNNLNTIWHAGNDGSGSGLDADTLDGVHLMGKGGNSGIMRAWNRHEGYTTSKQYFGNGNVVVIDPKPTDDSNLWENTTIFSLGDMETRSHQLAFGYGKDVILYRRVHDGPTYNSWKTIAFTTSNVASATKLQTARTIWGQSFDGTADVTGNINLPKSSKIFIKDASNNDICVTQIYGNDLHFGNGANSKGYDTYIGGNRIIMRYGTSSTWGFVLSETGNVGIGTTNPSAKLHVNGNILATGGVTMQSQRSLKNVVDEIGLSLTELSVIKPTRYTWKDKRDDRIHFGGIADDIEKVLPEVIYRTSDGTLTMDYGNAGFAIASSLIQPVVDHEQEIRMLKIKVRELQERLNRYEA